MIGYYIHHHGRGHLHRAITIAAATDTMVVGMSSLPRPPEWTGPWMVLPRDDVGPTPVDASANNRLHWVPELDSGLTARMADISSWIADIEPTLMIVDVSVEVSLLARLHGIPVVTMVLPGQRGDSAHELVHSVARRIIAVWPDDLPCMVSGLGAHAERLACVGGLSRFDARRPAPPPPRAPGEDRRALVLMGVGDAQDEAWDISAAQAQSPGWTWQFMGPGTAWVDDPWEAMCAADVIITHAGQNAVAEVAAARRPAIVVPQPRPFREQETMAATLATDGRFPVVVRATLPTTGWGELLDETARLDGSQWAGWNDGQGAERVARILEEELARVSMSRP